jgi:aminopeptidase N
MLFHGKFFFLFFANLLKYKLSESYDEPQIRAAYTLHMRHHQTYHALGNKPIVSITPPDQYGYVITSFEEIPSMHSYLNAFTVSDFTYVENATVRPPQRVYARRQRINNGDGSFALEVSPAVMQTCEEYYGFNYTFPKMDQVALTHFPAGAMENWGLVNYIEINLLFDPLISTTLNRDNIIRIIAHEFMVSLTFIA